MKERQKKSVSACDTNPPDLHKLFFQFSQPKSLNIFRIFNEFIFIHFHAFA